MKIVALARPTPAQAPEDGRHEGLLRNVHSGQQHAHRASVDGVHEAATSPSVRCCLNEVGFDLGKRRCPVTPITVGMAGVIAEAVDDGDAAA